MDNSGKYQLVEDFLCCLDKLVEFTNVELETGIETYELVNVLTIQIDYD
jgi:hypothetical protein